MHVVGDIICNVSLKNRTQTENAKVTAFTFVRLFWD